MINDLNNPSHDFFPSINGDNQKLLTLINKTSEILCTWFSDTQNLSPLPSNKEFRTSNPENIGCDINVLLEEIQNLVYSSFNPSHPGSLAHLDPPPLTISIIGDLIASALNNNLLAEELSPSLSILEKDVCQWFCNRIGFRDNSGGIAASGGTLNNLNALVTAKYKAGFTFDNDIALIISEDAHVSFKKCATILGLRNNNLYFIDLNYVKVLPKKILQILAKKTTLLIK